MPARPLPMEPGEAAALVEREGSISAAARHLGVPRHTLRHWLDPERGRAHMKKWYAANAERKRKQERERYDAMTGFQYNRMLLVNRRWDALRRRKKRDREREEHLGSLPE